MFWFFFLSYFLVRSNIVCYPTSTLRQIVCHISPAFLLCCFTVLSVSFLGLICSSLFCVSFVFFCCFLIFCSPVHGLFILICFIPINYYTSLSQSCFLLFPNLLFTSSWIIYFDLFSSHQLHLVVSFESSHLSSVALSLFDIKHSSFSLITIEECWSVSTSSINFCGGSFACITKSRGHKTVPWGTRLRRSETGGVSLCWLISVKMAIPKQEERLDEEKEKYRGEENSYLRQFRFRWPSPRSGIVHRASITESKF